MKTPRLSSLRALCVALLACLFPALPAAWAADTIFDYTGANQTFVVPSGVTSLKVRLWGAGGTKGFRTGVNGGGAAFATGYLEVTPGETLTILVGGVGVGSGGGFGGGGDGDLQYSSGGGGGGGRSAIQRGGADLVAAGGGGGAGYNYAGGAGGLTTGAAGGGTGAGGGGTQTASGNGGVNSSDPSNNGQHGTVGKGGRGGGDGLRGGGGGGGFFGGGGGAGSALTDFTNGPGGGGSSLLSALTDSAASEAGSLRTPGGLSDPFYLVTLGFGGLGGGINPGGHGRVVISPEVSIPSITDPETQLLYKTGDFVPPAGLFGTIVPAGAKLTSFGVPAISPTGATAFLMKWTSAAASETAILANGYVIAKVGGPVPGAGAGGLPANATFKSLKDPVIDATGNVAFLANLRGTGVRASNDTAIITLGGVLARKGSQAAEAPEGAVWTSFASLALPGGALGPIFLGTMARGGVTAKDDTAVWAVTRTGALRMIFREGDVVEGKTVKSFDVLKAVPGSPGQTRAFNGNRIIIWKATFTDGTSGILRTEVP